MNVPLELFECLILGNHRVSSECHVFHFIMSSQNNENDKNHTWLQPNVYPLIIYIDWFWLNYVRMLGSNTEIAQRSNDCSTVFGLFTKFCPVNRVETWICVRIDQHWRYIKFEVDPFIGTKTKDQKLYRISWNLASLRA